MTPGTCGKDGQSVPVGCGQGDAADHRRHPRGHGMSDELLEMAQSVVGRAVPGEGMEVYVTRGTETEVRAYEGEVESLTSADSSGVGIRVVLGDADAGGSQVGFAWAGSLDPDVIAATLADARDNARFATPDPDVVLAAPDGVEAVDLDLWDDGVGATPMEKKVALAIELERATRAADPKIRQVSSADYSDSRVEVALASTTGIVSSPRQAHQRLLIGRRHCRARGRRDADRGSGFSIGRELAERSGCPTRQWTTPSSGPPGWWGHRRCARLTARSSSTRAWSPHCWVGIAVSPVRRGGRQGAFVLRRPNRRDDRHRRDHAGRRPDRRQGVRRAVA